MSAGLMDAETYDLFERVTRVAGRHTRGFSLRAIGDMAALAEAIHARDEARARELAVRLGLGDGEYKRLARGAGGT